jgi:hypothetical protein
LKIFVQVEETYILDSLAVFPAIDVTLAKNLAPKELLAKPS